MPYRVKDWDKNFENDRSRQRDKCSFICVPNKQDGSGLINLLSEKDGAACYGVWQLILGACSRQRRPRQGWLTDDGTCSGRAWSEPELARRWRRDPREIERAFIALCDISVGWIERYDNSQSATHAVTAESPRIEVNRIEGKGKQMVTGLRPSRSKKAAKSTYTETLGFNPVALWCYRYNWANAGKRFHVLDGAGKEICKLAEHFKTKENFLKIVDRWFGSSESFVSNCGYSPFVLLKQIEKFSSDIRLDEESQSDEAPDPEKVLEENENEYPAESELEPALSVPLQESFKSGGGGPPERPQDRAGHTRGDDVP